MLSRKKFVKRFCSKCDTCTDIQITKKPSFCYDTIYVKKPSKFINNCFPKLLKTDIETMMEGRDDEAAVLKVFCSANMCGKKKACSEDQLDYCTTAFVSQILQMGLPEPPKGQLELEISSTKSKKSKKHKKSKKREKTSSFIFGGGEEWQILIQNVVEESNEVKDKQQDNSGKS